MEFDTSIQDRWRVSLGFFVAGIAVFGLVWLTGAAWEGWHLIVGSLVCAVGAFFALLSLAAGEKRRGMAWMALMLNVLMSGGMLVLPVMLMEE